MEAPPRHACRRAPASVRVRCHLLRRLGVCVRRPTPLHRLSRPLCVALSHEGVDGARRAARCACADLPAREQQPDERTSTARRAPTLHPDLLFLHGVTGSCLDASGARHPAVAATGRALRHRPAWGGGSRRDPAAHLGRPPLSRRRFPSTSRRAPSAAEAGADVPLAGWLPCRRVARRSPIDQAFDVQGVVAVDAMVPPAGRTRRPLPRATWTRR